MERFNWPLLTFSHSMNTSSPPLAEPAWQLNRQITRSFSASETSIKASNEELSPYAALGSTYSCQKCTGRPQVARCGWICSSHPGEKLGSKDTQCLGQCSQCWQSSQLRNKHQNLSISSEYSKYSYFRNEALTAEGIHSDLFSLLETCLNFFPGGTLDANIRKSGQRKESNIREGTRWGDHL